MLPRALCQPVPAWDKKKSRNLDQSPFLILYVLFHKKINYCFICNCSKSVCFPSCSVVLVLNQNKQPKLWLYSTTTTYCSLLYASRYNKIINQLTNRCYIICAQSPYVLSHSSKRVISLQINIKIVFTGQLLADYSKN